MNENTILSALFSKKKDLGGSWKACLFQSMLKSLDGVFLGRKQMLSSTPKVKLFSLHLLPHLKFLSRHHSEGWNINVVLSLKSRLDWTLPTARVCVFLRSFRLRGWKRNSLVSHPPIVIVVVTVSLKTEPPPLPKVTGVFWMDRAASTLISALVLYLWFWVASGTQEARVECGCSGRWLGNLPPGTWARSSPEWRRLPSSGPALVAGTCPTPIQQDRDVLVGKMASVIWCRMADGFRMHGWNIFGPIFSQMDHKAKQQTEAPNCLDYIFRLPWRGCKRLGWVPVVGRWVGCRTFSALTVRKHRWTLKENCSQLTICWKACIWEPDEMSDMRRACHICWKCVGCIIFWPSPSWLGIFQIFLCDFSCFTAFGVVGQFLTLQWT